MANSSVEKAKAALKNNTSTEIVKQTNLSPEQQKYSQISNMMEKLAPIIKQSIPKHVTPERLSRIALTEIRKNPKLLECSELSLLGAILQAAQLGLEIGSTMGECYIVPRRQRGQWDAQFQLGYKAIIKLFHQHESSLVLYGEEVRKNDDFEWEYGLEPKLKHKPALKNRGEVIGYYVVAKMKGGSYVYKFMPVEDIIEHAKKFADSYGSTYSPWTNNFEDMALKTVLKKMRKWLPLSTELSRAFAADETIKHATDIEIDGDIIEAQDYTDWQELPTQEVDNNLDDPKMIKEFSTMIDAINNKKSCDEALAKVTEFEGKFTKDTFKSFLNQLDECNKRYNK